MNAFILAAVLAACCAVATRYARDITSTSIATAVLAGVLFAAYDWAGVAYALAWAAWVVAAAHVMPPLGKRSLVTAYAWHAVSAVAMGVACLLTGQSVAAAFVWFGMFALFATALDGWRAKLVLDDDSAVDDPALLAMWLGGGAWGACLSLVA